MAENPPGQTSTTRDILTGVGAVPFEWTCSDDRLRWGANVLEVLELPHLETVATGRDWAAILDPETPGGRDGALARSVDTDAGAGVAYETTYAIRPDGSEGRQLHLQETGRWYSDGRGKPQRVIGLIRRVTPAEARVGRSSGTDALTGEMDRHGLAAALERALAAAVMNKGRIALVFASIDRLESINDTFGKQIGDAVLLGTMRRLKSRLRAGDVIGRIGGNRFAVILANCDDESASVAVRRFAGGIKEQPVETDIGPLWMTMAFGVVSIPAQAKTLAEAFERADEAMRRARKMGPGSQNSYKRNRHSSTMRAENRELAQEINRLIETGNVRLGWRAFAPLAMQLAGTGRAIAVADLADHGTVDLAPIAEPLGLLSQIDLWLLQATCRRLAEQPDLRLSIDVGSTSVATGIWAHKARTLLLRNPEIARRLTVTLSAQSLTQMPEAATKLISTVVGYGASIALSDFAAPGTDILFALSLRPARIDPAASLVEQAMLPGSDGLAVRAVTRLAETINARVLARGTVPPDAGLRLAEAGFDYVELSTLEEDTVGRTAA